MLYKQYITYAKRKTKETNRLFDTWDSYLNKNLTIQRNSIKFLDTKITTENSEIKIQALNKKSKYLIHWSSKVPFYYK